MQLLPDHGRTFTTQVIHLHLALQTAKMQFHLPAAAVQLAQLVGAINVGIQQCRGQGYLARAKAPFASRDNGGGEVVSVKLRTIVFQPDSGIFFCRARQKRSQQRCLTGSLARVWSHRGHGHRAGRQGKNFHDPRQWAAAARFLAFLLGICFLIRWRVGHRDGDTIDQFDFPTVKQPLAAGRFMAPRGGPGQAISRTTLRAIYGEPCSTKWSRWHNAAGLAPSANR